jgi:DNA polymerase III subunit alpha
MSFVHLHTHSQFSMLDSTIRVPDLVNRAVQDESAAIALTDHNNMFGAVEFFKAAQASKVKAILGAEVNIVAEDRRDAEVRRSATIVLLCKDDKGYRNLCYLLSRCHMDSPARLPMPRIDRGLLAGRCEGLLALSGGLSGEIPQALLRGDKAEAASLVRFYQGLFSEDFYLEIVRNGIKEQEQVNAELLLLSEELGVPLVAGADAHYARREDAGAHEVLMCVQMGRVLPTLETKARITDELHLAPASEMVERFADLPEAVANTQRIADACDVDLHLGKTYLPTYEVPEEYDTESYLRHLAGEGLTARLAAARALGREVVESDYRDRLDVELAIIEEMGFPGYFLIVWDFIRYAKEHDIPVGPGRGSGAGSLVAYCLSITDIDPLLYGLLFERFLNPERVSMPDFDIDFCMYKRDQVIRYVTQKYGEDNVGQIITYGTMKAKAVVRDVSRVYGLTFAEADRAAKLIPEDLGMTLAKAFDAEPRLTALCEEDPRYARLFEVARTLEGLNRQPGMHAAGVVIGDKPLWEYVPLYAVHGDDGEITRITQFAKNEVEEAGLVKFDFLGLKTLTVVDHAVRLVNDGRRVSGEERLDISELPLDDRSVFELITSGDTTGVFQLESSGFKELLRKLKPDCIEDIIAAVALYRPGPLQSGMVDAFIRRKHGEEKVEYPHPSLATTLEETYGVMVYQEQVMQAARTLAGFSLGQADIMRRAMGKKKPAEMAKQGELFRQGCVANGVPAEQADSIFGTIEKFAGYGFNKSHSAAYGMISYQTAWLKKHYPVEFMAALLSSDRDNTDKVVRLISEARSMGITVRPPSVNASSHDFTVDQGAVRFGLGAVKGVGGGAVESILAAREDVSFDGLLDFCDRVDTRRVNRRVLEALVKCGAFDEFDNPRLGLFSALDKAIERAQSLQRDRESGQFNLFGELEPAEQSSAEALKIDATDEWPDKVRLAFEKESLGFYVSGHPLDQYGNEVRRLACAPIQSLASRRHREEVLVGCVVSELRERVLKSGKGRMAFVAIEDQTARTEVIVFSRVFAASEEALKSDEPLLVRAVLQHEGEGESTSIKLRAESIVTLASIRAEQTAALRLEVDAAAISEDLLDRLEPLLLTNPEALPVVLALTVPNEGRMLLNLAPGYRLSSDDETVARVERVTGRGSVIFQNHVS